MKHVCVNQVALFLRPDGEAVAACLSQLDKQGPGTTTEWIGQGWQTTIKDCETGCCAGATDEAESFDRSKEAGSRRTIDRPYAVVLGSLPAASSSRMPPPRPRHRITGDAQRIAAAREAWAALWRGREAAPLVVKLKIPDTGNQLMFFVKPVCLNCYLANFYGVFVVPLLEAHHVSGPSRSLTDTA